MTIAIRKTSKLKSKVCISFLKKRLYIILKIDNLIPKVKYFS